jgi:peroxiredoxin
MVIGAYHHKERTHLTIEHVRAHADDLHFHFPIAIDYDWQTLRRWWLDRSKRGWTSATFLLGRDGTIRHVHAGGAYFKGEPGYAALESAIRTAWQKRNRYPSNRAAA